MELVEIKVEIARDSVPAADDILLELGEGGWSIVEDVVAQRAWLVGIFADGPAARARWNDLVPLLEAAGFQFPQRPVLSVLKDEDWKESYKAHFKAWRFGPLHWVPVWERATFQAPAGARVLWLDPGMAFGTGNHETTRLCCERLVGFAESRGTTGRVLDAGCGSGILALSAVRLGFERVAAFDNDPLAVGVSRENAVLNGLGGRVEFFVADLTAGLAGRAAELVLANIQADVLSRFAVELVGAVAPGGQLILSGILARELAPVRAVFQAALPAAAVDSRDLGEWSDLVLTRPA